MSKKVTDFIHELEHDKDFELKKNNEFVQDFLERALSLLKESEEEAKEQWYQGFIVACSYYDMSKSEFESTVAETGESLRDMLKYMDDVEKEKWDYR